MLHEISEVSLHRTVKMDFMDKSSVAEHLHLGTNIRFQRNCVKTNKITQDYQRIY